MNLIISSYDKAAEFSISAQNYAENTILQINNAFDEKTLIIPQYSIDNANAAAENARLAANNTYNEFLKIKTSYDKLSKDSIEIDEATNYYNNTIDYYDNANYYAKIAETAIIDSKLVIEIKNIIDNAINYYNKIDNTLLQKNYENANNYAISALTEIEKAKIIADKLSIDLYKSSIRIIVNSTISSLITNINNAKKNIKETEEKNANLNTNLLTPLLNKTTKIY